jgi:hypothetical protein
LLCFFWAQPPPPPPRLPKRGMVMKPKKTTAKKVKASSSLFLEPVFVNLLGSPGIDSQPGGPVQQPYFPYGPARLHRLAKSVSRKRLLGSINVYKYGLCTVHCKNVLYWQASWRARTQSSSNNIVTSPL